MKEFLTDLNTQTKAGSIVLDKDILDLDFNTVKENHKDKLDKYLERWGELGFIEGLSGETRERVTYAMEQFAVYLLTEDDDESDEGKLFEVVGFPIIRRLIAGSVAHNKDLKHQDLFNFRTFIEYKSHLNISGIVNKLIKLENPVNNIDVEAEAIVMACEIMIDKFNGDERSVEEITENYINKIEKKYERVRNNNTNA